MELVATPVILQGESLVVNNLVASALWHKFTVLQASRWITSRHSKDAGLIFFGQDSIGFDQLSYFCLCKKAGQGLVDIRSRLMAFRLQAAQRLLYNSDIAWLNTAVAL